MRRNLCWKSKAMKSKEELIELEASISQSSIAYIIPPKQRKKSRYQNIKIISDWCMKAIASIENKKTDDSIKEHLSRK